MQDFNFIKKIYATKTHLYPKHICISYIFNDGYTLYYGVCVWLLSHLKPADTQDWKYNNID